jgi:hypothetical protein
MTININSPVTVSSFWVAFKSAAITIKALPVQYDDDGIKYTIFCLDNQIAYICNIWKSTVPSDVITSYSQSQNDTDKSDFETNYKTTANAKLSRTDNYGDNIYVPFTHAAIFGLIPGVISGTVNGYLSTSSTSSLPIRATSYISGVSAAQRSINSTSVNDTSAGTGAQQIQITYYDGSMNGPLTETITTNGTTAVNTVNTNIQFIEKIAITQVGSGGSNAGTIQLFTTVAGGGSIMGSIATGDNQTFWAHHYIPTGKKCYLLGVRACASITTGAINMFATGSPLLSNIPTLNISGNIRHGAANSIISDYEWDVPLVITGPNLLYCSEKPDASTASTSYCSFDYIQF